MKQFCHELWFVKECWNCAFKVNFLFQKLMEFHIRTNITVFNHEKNMRIKGEMKYISRTLFIHSRWPLPVPSSVRILSGLLVSLKHVKWNKTACAKNFSPQIQTLRFTEYLYYNNTSIIYFFKCTVYCTLTIFMCHMQMCVV